MARAPRQQANPKSATSSRQSLETDCDLITRLLLVVTAFCIGGMFGCLPTAELPKMPDDLRTAKIDQGKADFGKKVFDEYPNLGLITDLHYGRFNSDLEPQLAVVGAAGAAFVGSDHRVQKNTHFAIRMFGHVVLIGPKDGGTPEFLGRGGNWNEKVRVFDKHGALLWDYGSLWGIDDAAYGDVNGDGKWEVAVGLNGGGGVRLLDAKGRELWSKLAGNVWHVEVINAEEGRGGEIIHSDASGALTFRNGAGEVLLTFHPTQYVSSFGLTRWPTDHEPHHIIIPGQDVIEILDVDGHQIARLDAPRLSTGSLLSIAGTAVCFSNRRCYHATLVDYPLWDRSILYMNDLKGTIAYREVFEHRCAAVGAMPTASGSQDESLLVGCSSEVWKYFYLH